MICLDTCPRSLLSPAAWFSWPGLGWPLVMLVYTASGTWMSTSSYVLSRRSRWHLMVTSRSSAPASSLCFRSVFGVL